MGYGKTIELFFVDGTAEGIVTAELSNWNGKAIKIPRAEVASYAREDVSDVGVYFLFVQGHEGEEVYIGESEDVLKRLQQHLKDDGYWNAAVAFVGRDLNKALIRYLEHELVGCARACGRCKVLTQNTYVTHLKEAQVASMGEFIENVKTLLSALGYKALVPMPKATETTTILHCKSGKGAAVQGFVSPGGFTVMEGSRVAADTVPSLQTRGKSYYDLRVRLMQEGVIEGGAFTRDYEFAAPSAASAVVLGRTSNGNVDWKTEAGAKLGELA